MQTLNNRFKQKSIDDKIDICCISERLLNKYGHKFRDSTTTD